MVRLHFNNTSEFEGLFKRKTLQVTRTIVDGVQKAYTSNKRSAPLFEITFDDVDTMYEISLPKSQWPMALEHCLDHLHKEDLADEQIDCWSLLESLKKT